MSTPTQLDCLYYVNGQAFGVRVLTYGDRTDVLWQCPTCREFSVAPHRVEVGPEGISLAPAPPWPAEIVCGHASCRATWIVWRGNGYVRGPAGSP